MMVDDDGRSPASGEVIKKDGAPVHLAVGRSPGGGIPRANALPEIIEEMLVSPPAKAAGEDDWTAIRRGRWSLKTSGYFKEPP